MYNYSLNYRTFDTLMADVASDFKKYQLEDLIDAQDAIKVAKRVNYDLGLRIHQTKQVILEVEKGKVRLPNNFYVLEFALVVSNSKVVQAVPQGTNVEDKIVGTLAPKYFGADPIVVGSCDLTCKGEIVQLTQTVNYETREYQHIQPLRITQNTEDINGLCPNLYWDSVLTGVVKDGWLHTSFTTGKVYLNYQGYLEDDEGNLLVPDHDLLNEYYEYAVKQRIIENLIMNDEEVNPNKLQLIEQRFRAARNNALSLVNTPNFGELKELYQSNRNAQYSKYYDMFASYPRHNLR